MKINFKAMISAGFGVVAGLVMFNNLRSLAGNTVIGKILNGDLIRRAG